MMAYRLRRFPIAAAMVCAVGVGCALSQCGNAEAQSPEPSSPSSEMQGRIDQLIRSGDLTSAIELGRQLDQPSAPTAMTIARLAETLRRSGDLKTAAEFFSQWERVSRGVKLHEQADVAIHLAAASVFMETHDEAAALRNLTSALEHPNALSQDQQRYIHQLGIRIGSQLLSQNHAELAETAYELALNSQDESVRAVAELGYAWSVAIGGDRPVLAAQRLAAFVDHYPDHADAPSAARACAKCLQDAGRHDDADAILADLLDRWPDCPSAYQVIKEFVSTHPGPIDSTNPTDAPNQLRSAVAKWFVDTVASDSIPQVDLSVAIEGALQSIKLKQPSAMETWAGIVAQRDSTGNGVSELLERLSTSGHPADAERLAAGWISPPEQTDVPAPVREAACRWAGRRQHWTMLALAAESTSPESSDPTRTVAVERLYAEALTQTGDSQRAHQWWNWIVDHRQANDFATLLRCAELETSVGTDIKQAERRIAMARDAAGDDPHRIALIDLLAAEVAIRNVQFDVARSLLENIVRSNHVQPTLRARAQWMIGETYYLQGRFAEAVESYRRVEGIDVNGTWVAASLLQAGKAFEQLGRTREAAVCYGHLTSRFADTSHAMMARRRLAALGTQSEPLNAKPSIRR